MSSELMTIHEMSDHFGVSLQQLRFYEDKGLLQPASCASGRLYDKKCRARLKLILRGQSFGFKLEEMRHLLNLYDEGKQGQLLTEAHGAGVVYLQDLKKKRWRLDETIAELELRLFNYTEQLAVSQDPQPLVVSKPVWSLLQ